MQPLCQSKGERIAAGPRRRNRLIAKDLRREGQFQHSHAVNLAAARLALVAKRPLP